MSQTPNASFILLITNSVFRSNVQLYILKVFSTALVPIISWWRWTEHNFRDQTIPNAAVSHGDAEVINWKVNMGGRNHCRKIDSN
jgi:nicotinamide riboside transporter PnuC